MYRLLSIYNDIKALCKGKILGRIWNKIVMRTAMKFIKR